MKVECVTCGKEIAIFTADTSRKNSEKKADAVCKTCYNNKGDE